MTSATSYEFRESSRPSALLAALAFSALMLGVTRTGSAQECQLGEAAVEQVYGAICTTGSHVRLFLQSDMDRVRVATLPGMRELAAHLAACKTCTPSSIWNRALGYSPSGRLGGAQADVLQGSVLGAIASAGRNGDRLFLEGLFRHDRPETMYVIGAWVAIVSKTEMDKWWLLANPQWSSFDDAGALDFILQVLADHDDYSVLNASIDVLRWEFPGAGRRGVQSLVELSRRDTGLTGRALSGALALDSTRMEWQQLLTIIADLPADPIYDLVRVEAIDYLLRAPLPVEDRRSRFKLILRRIVSDRFRSELLETLPSTGESTMLLVDWLCSSECMDDLRSCIARLGTSKDAPVETITRRVIEVFRKREDLPSVHTMFLWLRRRLDPAERNRIACELLMSDASNVVKSQAIEDVIPTSELGVLALRHLLATAASDALRAEAVERLQSAEGHKD